jgi:hypothetical protein
MSDKLNKAKIINLDYNEEGYISYDRSYYGGKYIIGRFEELDYDDIEYGIRISFPSKKLEFKIYDISGIDEEKVREELDYDDDSLTDEEVEEIVECFNLYDDGIPDDLLNKLHTLIDEQELKINKIKLKYYKLIMQKIKEFNINN